MNASMTYVMYWASRMAQNTSSCLGALGVTVYRIVLPFARGCRVGV